MSELSPRAGAALRRFTSARVGQLRAGVALATAEQLQFQLDHARARDAVHAQPDFAHLIAGLEERRIEPLLLDSAIPRGANARNLYLRRPDLGRSLNSESAQLLAARDAEVHPELVFVLADGLSGLALDRHALPLLDALLPLFPPEFRGQAPVCLVRNGRVAIGDEIGHILRARMTVLLIGERPGLSAPDSLGVYLTSDPRPGRSDAERNCISNIRQEGLSYEQATRRIAFYIEAARRAGGTGFALKDDSSPNLHAIG